MSRGELRDGADLRIGFVGAGQLATPLAWCLSRARYRVVGAAGRSHTSAERLVSGVEGAKVYGTVQALLDDSDLVIVAVPDDAIAPVTRSLTWEERHSVIHCSGATEVAALSAAATAGAATGGFHPLQTFTNTQAAMATLPGCTVAIEAEGDLHTALWAMATALGCSPIRLPAGARALYHASGSFAASFLVRLMNDALDLWSTFGVSREDAFRALLPLTKGTVSALDSNGPIRALAGPIARADVGTVVRHIEGLRTRAPHLLPIYLDLARRSVALSEQKGAADTERLAALKVLLDQTHS